MKLKQAPEDFVVEERARLAPSDRGRYAVYRLSKRGLGTLEALRAIGRAWRVPNRAVGFGGLKDRHASTTQWVTIDGGPHRHLDAPDFRLSYEGRSDQPMSRMLLTGNRFRIRVRDLSREEAATAVRRFEGALRTGLPSYFDEQRFGSLRGGGGFAALHLLRGDAEAALKAVIASPSPEDRAAIRARKSWIRSGWGRFEDVVPRLQGTLMRAPVAWLASHPGDFLGAFATLDREERRLFASAYASAVWNRAVATRVREALPPAERFEVPGPSGSLVFARDPDRLAGFAGATLPMPARGARADDPSWQAALEASLAEDGLALEALALPHALGMPLRPTRRPVLFRPEEGTARGPIADERNPGRSRVDLDFVLGPGLYATILVKVLTHDAEGAGGRRRRRKGGR